VEKEIFKSIGNTPLVRLYGFEKQKGIKAHIFAKLEYMNPFGSIKDRAAYQIIIDAEKSGILKPGGEIIEASSGNMGIALTAISQLKGYQCTIIMPENMSEKRKELIKSYGAELILTNAKHGMKGSINMLEKLKNEHSFLPNQFRNISNALAHYISTAREIDLAIEGGTDAIICGIGSGGTISGLKKYFINSEVIGVVPSSKKDIIPGIGAGFTPFLVDNNTYKSAIKVTLQESIDARNCLLKTDGMFAGYSSGAVLSACEKICQNKDYQNKNIVLIFADSGERYI
jgi:cysteine synthase A